LEGEHNELGDYGYNRDKKRGKKQVVIGLLCDDEGVPVSVETFSGNTSDQATFFNQVNKLVKRFGCERVTMVGDRGMIKSAQVEAIEKAGFHYITAITKAEIESLVKRDIIQMDCFEDKLFEAVDGDIRYVLRRNPVRAEEMKEIRLDKKAKIERMVETKNEYLSEHPKAQVEVALRDVKTRINKLYVSRWLKVISKGRELYLDKDEAALSEESRYDGCYVLKTDLSSDVASKDVIHDRYKDLGEVESSFRIIKSTHLEVRPIHVRLKDHTRAHVFVVMLAYMIRQELKRCWEKMNITVKEGIANLSSVCGTAIMINNVPFCYKIPLPRDTIKELLDSAKITLPDVLPTKGIKVTTKNKTRIMR
jgi:transposase